MRYSTLLHREDINRHITENLGVRLYAKKGSKTKTTSWKVIAQVVLVSMNMAIYFLAPRVGYFAHMDLKQKWNVFKINAK